MWSGNFKTAIGSLRLAKWRSILTMMGIIIGITSVVTVVSLGEGLKQQVVGQIGSLGNNVLSVRSGKLLSSKSSGDNLNILAFLSASTLTKQDVASAQKLPSVSSVAPIDFVSSSANSGGNQLDNIYVVGTNSGLPDILHQKVAYGGFFSSDDGSTNVAVIGSDVAYKLFGELNPVGQSINVSGQSFIIRGVLAPSSSGLLSIAQIDFNSSVFMPFGLAQNLTHGNTNILQILVKSRPGKAAAATAGLNSSILKNHSGQQDFTVLTQDQLLDLAGSLVDNFSHFIIGIAAISLLVGGIGIMDIMLVSVSERTREIGIRKALGATNRQILNQFLVEGLVLTLGGGIIGVICSLIAYAVLRFYSGLHPVLTVSIMALAVVTSVLIGIVFSVAPALKAAHKDPIDALRG